jgi:hypothetical protein
MRSKNEYQTAFKMWGFRKHLCESEWKFIGHRIKKRKLDKKETEVYLNDVLIKPERIKKELSRHFTPRFSEPYATGDFPALWSGRLHANTIRTPESPNTPGFSDPNTPEYRDPITLEYSDPIFPKYSDPITETSDHGDSAT